MGYSKESYLKAKTILDRRRIESENALEERRNILFNRSPEARELERRIARTSLDAARAVYSGKDVKSELENLKIKNQTSQKRIDDIIGTIFGKEDKPYL